MNDAISAAISLLEAAKALPAADAKATLHEVVRVLIEAMKQQEGPDVDPGTGN
jgi:hypothetical protein